MRDVLKSICEELIHEQNVVGCFDCVPIDHRSHRPCFHTAYDDVQAVTSKIVVHVAACTRDDAINRVVESLIATDYCKNTSREDVTQILRVYLDEYPNLLTTQHSTIIAHAKNSSNSVTVERTFDDIAGVV
jgi:hypothetical protein